MHKKAVILDSESFRNNNDIIVNEMRDIWVDYELGNDWYYFPFGSYIYEDYLYTKENHPELMKDVMQDSPYPVLFAYCDENFPDYKTEDFEILIRFWW